MDGEVDKQSTKKRGRGGNNNPRGRPKGVPNKFTADLKACILEAFHNAGGAAYLQKVAAKNPAVFCGLIGKVLPLTVVGDAANPVVVQLIERRIVRPTDPNS